MCNNRVTLATIFFITSLGSHGIHAGGVDVYVSPTGNDASNGHSPVAQGAGKGPLATFHGARQAVRRLKTASQGAGQPITVHISAGDYFFDSSLEWTADDSGTPDAPVTFAAEGAGPVRLIGGRRLAMDWFVPVTDPATLELLPPEVREQVRRVDLRTAGITQLGRLPDAFKSPPAVPELFFNDARMTLARWPNQDWTTVARVIESGPAEWRNHKSDAAATFEYSGDRPRRWLHAPGVWLMGYWCFDWADETIRVGRIDADKRQITLGSPHVYGLGSGNPAPRRYYAVNLLEELDSPGEYFIDRDRGQLYFLPPGPLNGARIVLSTLTSPLITMKDVSNLVLRGLTVESCAGSGIEISQGRNVRIEACEIRNTGHVGITISGGSHHAISRCVLHDTGTLAVSVEGGDRKTLTPCQHEVINNHIYRPSRRQLTYAGHIHVGGVGVRVAHNHLHDGPHLAIILHGNDHVIEFNDIHDVATETDDCGAFYMGRNPSERGTIIRYNFWHNVGSRFAHGSCAVYFDDGAGGQTVTGNVFYRAAGGSFGAVFVHGGHDNTVTNNVFIECKRALGAAPWDDKRWKDYVNAPLWQQVLRKDVDITRPPYVDRYPDLAGFMQPGDRPRLNHASRNVVIQCADFVKGNWEQKDNLVIEADPGFVGGNGFSYPRGESSGVFQRLKGFEPIPFSKIGIEGSADAPTSSTASGSAASKPG